MTYDFNQLIGSVKLSKGTHENAESGMCAMEFVSWLEGEKFSDHPQCTCPVIAAFVRCANYRMDQDGRDRLLSYLPKIVGTVSTEHEQERAEYLAWQAIRVFAPNALIAIGLHEHAKKLIKADTLDAAYAARAAARAAAAADAAAAEPNWDDLFATMEGVLEIGPETKGFTQPVEPIIEMAKAKCPMEAKDNA